MISLSPLHSGRKARFRSKSRFVVDLMRPHPLTECTSLYRLLHGHVESREVVKLCRLHPEWLK